MQANQPSIGPGRYNVDLTFALDRRRSHNSKRDDIMINNNRSAKSMGFVIKLAAALSITAMSYGAIAAKPDERLSGVWRIKQPIGAVRSLDGKELPLNADAARIYREHLADRKRGDTSFDATTWCASAGMPRMLFIDSPFEIVVRPNYVAFLHEWNWWARIVYLKGALSAEPAAGAAPVGPPPPANGRPMLDLSAGSNLPGPMGFSEGHWEGDTLVVETTRLSDLTLIDGAGVPHSDALKLTEKLKLRSPNELQDRIRIEDQNTFTQPWETVVTYLRQPTDTQIQEDVCLDRIQTGLSAVKE